MRRSALAAMGLAIRLIWSGVATAHEQHHHASGPSAAVVVAEERLPTTDAVLLDQDGRVRSFIDLLGDGPFIVSFSYGNCDQQCPVSDLVMDGVATQTAKAEPGARLVTLTLDPERDDVDVVNGKHDLFGSPLHWTWATGEPSTVHRLLRVLGAETGPLEKHDAMFLVGNARTSRMTRVIGLAKPDALLALLRQHAQ